MKIEYRPIAISGARLAVVEQAEAIAADYAAQGYDLTLRQLYYQFVARDLLPNHEREYKRLGDILNDARLAGLLDWDYIVDRTREFKGGDANEITPEAALRQLARWHAVPRWPGQATRAEVWVEKEALAGVVERAAERRAVGYFSCRGYASASALWQAAQRLEGHLDTDGVERVVVLHLGDHDPSGIDMTRDMTDRLEEFLAGDGYDPGQLELRRIALNMDQVQQYNPPPNPAKMTDSRSGSYVARYGRSSWELDALDPATLDALITTEVDAAIDDPALWRTAEERERRERTQLRGIADRWAELTEASA